MNALTLSKAENYIVLGAIVIGIYAVWRLSRVVGAGIEAAQSVAGSVASPIAEGIFRATSGPAAAVRGVVKFANGSEFTLNDLVAEGARTEWVNGALYLTWQGREYEITSPRDGSGTYQAEPV